MILSIYRSCVTVVQRSNGDIPSMWHVCRFTPIEPRCKTSSGIWYVETDGCSRPTIHVKTPPLCKMVEQLGKPRLATPYDSYGHDATSVYHMATNGLRGFSITAEPIAQVATTERDSSTTVIPTPEPGSLLPVPLSIVVEVRSSHHVDPEARSYVAAAPEDRFNTTWFPDEIRVWPSRQSAERWLESSVVGNDRPIPLGKHWIRARVVEIDFATLRADPRPDWLNGIRWCYRYPTPAIPGEITTPDWINTPDHFQRFEPAPVVTGEPKPKRTPDAKATQQIAFAFAD